MIDHRTQQVGRDHRKAALGTPQAEEPGRKRSGPLGKGRMRNSHAALPIDDRSASVAAAAEHSTAKVADDLVGTTDVGTTVEDKLAKKKEKKPQITRCIRLVIAMPLSIDGVKIDLPPEVGPDGVSRRVSPWRAVNAPLRKLVWANFRAANRALLEAYIAEEARVAAWLAEKKRAEEEKREERRIEMPPTRTVASRVFAAVLRERLGDLGDHDGISYIVDGASARIASRVAKDREKIASGEGTLSTFRPSLPIPIRDRALKPGRDEKGYVVTVRGLPGLGAVTFAMKSPNRKKSIGWFHGIMRRIVDGTYKIGSGGLSYDRRPRHRDWKLMLSYTEGPKIDVAKQGDLIVAVHGGIKNAVVAFDSRGRQIIWESGERLTHLRNQFRARRRELKRQKRYSLTGHGYPSLGRAIDRMENKESEQVQYYLRNLARAIVNRTRARGGHRIVVGYFPKLADDPLRNGKRKPRNADKPTFDVVDDVADDDEGMKRLRWLISNYPHARLRDAIVSAAERTTIEGWPMRCDVVKSRYVSQECPRCECTSVRNVDVAAHSFTCIECGHSRNMDTVACENFLKRAGAVDITAQTEAVDAAAVPKAGSKRENQT